MPYDRSTPFNDLPLLPPANNVENDVEVLIKLNKTSRVLATANGSVKQLPNPYMLINMIALQEAKTSTAIEQIKDTTAVIGSSQSQTVISRGQSEFRSGEVVYTPSRGAGILE